MSSTAVRTILLEQVIRTILTLCLDEVILWISQLISAAHVRTRETEQLAPFLTLPGRSTTGPSDEQLRMMTWALIAAVWNDTNRDIEAVTNVIRNLAIFDEISLHPTEDIFPL